MTPAEASTYITAHDSRVKQISRLTLLRLKSLHRDALAASGIMQVWGGPVSHDEYVNAVLELEFPAISQAREIYVQSVVAASNPHKEADQ